MARLTYLNPEDLAEEGQRLLARPANLYRLLVHSPDAYRNFARLGGWIRSGSTLDPRLREMAILQVGYLAGSSYEWTHHIKLAREDFGVSDDDIRAIVAESNGGGSALPDLDRAVLRLAREMTADVAGSQEALSAVGAELSDEHVVDLCMTIAYYNLVVRVLLTLDVDLEPEYESVLEEFPLPEGPLVPVPVQRGAS
jgi:alkylhydroperoxidase family enzyme